ncbi:hypothetical protein D3C85_887150 [compost metagenome]
MLLARTRQRKAGSAHSSPALANMPNTGCLAWAWARSQRPRAGSRTMKASTNAITRAGRATAKKALRQPYWSTTQAPTLSASMVENVGAAV